MGSGCHTTVPRKKRTLFSSYLMNHTRGVICYRFPMRRITHNDSAMTTRRDGQFLSHLPLFLLSPSLFREYRVLPTHPALRTFIVSGETRRGTETGIAIPLANVAFALVLAVLRQRVLDGESRSTPIGSDTRLRYNLFSHVHIYASFVIPIFSLCIVHISGFQKITLLFMFLNIP